MRRPCPAREERDALAGENGRLRDAVAEVRLIAEHWQRAASHDLDLPTAEAIGAHVETLNDCAAAVLAALTGLA